MADCLLQAVLRAVAMLAAWAPSQQEHVAKVLKSRFSSFSQIMQDVSFGVTCVAGASQSSEAQLRYRFVHTLLLNYARGQARERNPTLFS